MPRNRYQFGQFTLDPAQRTLKGPSGAPSELSGKAFDTLVCLVEHAGESLSRKTLLNLLWPDRIVEDNSLTKAIGGVRGILGNGYVATLTGRGYQFIAPVRLVNPDPVAARDACSSPPDSVAATEARAESPVRLWRQSSPVARKSIAVLPIESLTTEPAKAYCAAGIHEELIERLSKFASLRVLSRLSGPACGQNPPGVSVFEERLEVEALLWGSARFDSDRIRVTMKMTHPRTQLTVWSKTYENDLSDIFRMQSAIASQVTHAVGTQLALAAPDDEIPRPSVRWQHDFPELRNSQERALGD